MPSPLNGLTIPAASPTRACRASRPRHARKPIGSGPESAFPRRCPRDVPRRRGASRRSASNTRRADSSLKFVNVFRSPGAEVHRSVGDREQPPVARHQVRRRPRGPSTPRATARERIDPVIASRRDAERACSIAPHARLRRRTAIDAPSAASTKRARIVGSSPLLLFGSVAPVTQPSRIDRPERPPCRSRKRAPAFSARRARSSSKSRRVRIEPEVRIVLELGPRQLHDDLARVDPQPGGPLERGIEVSMPIRCKAATPRGVRPSPHTFSLGNAERSRSATSRPWRAR